MREAVIVEAVRTPIGKRNGALSGIHPVEMSAHVLSAVVERTGLDSALVDDVVWGCVTQIGDQSSNVARYATLAAELSPHDIGIFEVNEAFASVPLAWLAEIGADADRVNPFGGAIALGHPLGASGAILMTRMVHAMRDLGLRYGLQTMCEGGGTANATIVELAS